MPTANLRGINVAYDVQGEGEPMVLVHGWLTSHEIWSPVVADLANRFRTVTYDLRGHGGTGKGDLRRLSIEDFASDLRALLDHLGIDAPHLVGHSLGSAVACQFAAEIPRRVRCLVLADGAAGAPPGLRTGLALARLLGTERTIRLMAPRFFHPVTDEKVRDLLRTYRMAGNEAALASGRVLTGYRAPLGLSSLAVPALLAYGSEDGNRTQATALGRLLPNARMEVLPGGHMLPVDQPGMFGSLVAEFCTGHR